MLTFPYLPGTCFEVVLTTDCTYTCECLYDKEYHRPCGHVVAAMMGNDTPYDVWDIRWFGKCWHTRTWQKQYEKKLKRVAMKPYEFVVEDLVPALLTARTGVTRCYYCHKCSVTTCYYCHNKIHLQFQEFIVTIMFYCDNKSLLSDFNLYVPLRPRNVFGHKM
jgi:hypothetical protein